MCSNEQESHDGDGEFTWHVHDADAATDGEAPGDGSDKDPDDDVSVRACCSTRTGSSWGKPGWRRKRPRSETPTGIPKMCGCAECESS